MYHFIPYHVEHRENYCHILPMWLALTAQKVYLFLESLRVL